MVGAGHAALLVLLAGLLLLLDGCKRGSTAQRSGPPGPVGSTGPLLEAADNEQLPRDAGARRRGPAPAAGQRVPIPAGSFVAGSTPGDRGRDATLEPALVAVELGAFEIDRLPYPNDPRKPPRAGLGREQAGKLCAERGGRLCTELQWERACKGPRDDPYAGADRWAERCAAADASCASGFGVLGMGALREWTASDVLPIENAQPRAAAVRGAPDGAGEEDHRCAHRAAVPPSAQEGDLAFRCCYGAPSAAQIPPPSSLPAFRKTDLPTSRLEALLASAPALAAVASGIKYFREDNAIETVKRRGEAARGPAGLPSAAPAEAEAEAGAPATPPIGTMTTSPLLWSPVPGEEILVAAGQSGRNSFVVALYRLPDDRYRVGSSFLLMDEPGPVVLAYDPSARRRLEWLTCLGCYGESGGITYRPDGRVVITQR